MSCEGVGVGTLVRGGLVTSGASVADDVVSVIAIISAGMGVVSPAPATTAVVPAGTGAALPVSIATAPPAAKASLTDNDLLATDSSVSATALSGGGARSPAVPASSAAWDAAGGIFLDASSASRSISGARGETGKVMIGTPVVDRAPLLPGSSIDGVGSSTEMTRVPLLWLPDPTDAKWLDPSSAGTTALGGACYLVRAFTRASCTGPRASAALQK